MSKRRKCKNFAWRDEDPAWIAERQNDRIVFRKIRRETRRGQSAAHAIAALFASENWAWRMVSKKPKSWKDCYHLWRKKRCTHSNFGYDVQAEKSSFDP